MKISIIIPVYRDSISLPKMFDHFSKQKSNNYELILIVDSNIEKSIKVIDDNKHKIKGEMKLIFNSKRMGRTLCVAQGIEVATGEYISILSVSDIFDEKFIFEIEKLILQKPADIIEFNAAMSSPIKFEGKIRRQFNRIVEIKSKPEIFAFTYLFEFNKIFKREVLLSVIDEKNILNKNNGRFVIELVIKSLLQAETYVTKNVTFVHSKQVKDVPFNPLQVCREWTLLLKNERIEEHYPALIYNKYFTYRTIMSGIVSVTKNKNLISKVKNAINDEFGKDSSFFENNPYWILNDPETQKLKELRNSSSLKLYKEFN